MADPDRTVIEAMRAEDWADVAVVYRQGLETGDASFETEVPAYEEWDRDHLAAPRLVARAGGRLVGWAALSPVSGPVRVRRAWPRTASTSIPPPPAAASARRLLTGAGHPGGAGRDLDDPGRHLPREPGQHRAPPAVRFPRSSACASGWVSTTAVGATSYCSSGAASSSRWSIPKRATAGRARTPAWGRPAGACVLAARALPAGRPGSTVRAEARRLSGGGPPLRRHAASPAPTWNQASRQCAWLLS